GLDRVRGRLSTEEENFTKHCPIFVGRNNTAPWMFRRTANGKAERAVQKLTRILRKVCSEKQNKWHEYLHKALWAINITVNDLGYSPFQLVYGRDAVTPIELTLESYQVIIAKD
ncbi:3415_t:CDS:2, partial [Scutellospora calospora]